MKHLRIGTRDSKLAKKQANEVLKKLELLGVTGELVFIKSKGDKLQKVPLQELGSTGIFTKELDNALLDGKIDCAVHSLKDVPTTIHEELQIGATLERQDPRDALVLNQLDFTEDENYTATVATGSVRRRAQWLNKYPQHTVVSVRGNVDLRLRKLRENNWDGMILAAAGLIRLKAPVIYKPLDWMIPAPGQGAIAILCRKEDEVAVSALSGINHSDTFTAVFAERIFLNRLHAGCSTAVGAHAKRDKENIYFRAEILSEDGKQKIEVELSGKLAEAEAVALKAAETAIQKGADKLLGN